jgi:hypothetical protein
MSKKTFRRKTKNTFRKKKRTGRRAPNKHKLKHRHSHMRRLKLKKTKRRIMKGGYDLVGG